MVLSNSTPNNLHKQHELIVDTAAMNSEDLSELIQLNAEIEERRSRHLSNAHCSDDGRGLLRATMTREELFEVSSLDDDRFLTALEFQNSYVPSALPSRQQVTDLDLSSIENLMKYFDEEVPTTPSKGVTTNCTGKVASAIAKLSSQQSSTSTVTSPRQPKLDSGKQKINELKQKYEQPQQQDKQESQLATPQAVRGARFPMKVKEMAQLFNSKFNQVMRRAETSNYSTLHNELSQSLSPERKSPERKSSPGPCLVAEDVFRELSVKDKVLLFDKFVSDIAAKHPKFNEHAADLRAQAKRQMARGEVVAEQQASVKLLAQELEAKCSLQATPVPHMRSATAAVAATPVAAAPATLGATQAETPSTPGKLHVSTLTVVLKASPERHVIPLSQSPSQLQSSQKRNLSAIRGALPIEAYAPPKKIRRTRQERYDSYQFFQNEPLENLFYNWLSAKNGVLFDITSAADRDQTIEIATSCCEELFISHTTASSIGDLSQKSAVERLLEEAIAKLELESKSKESSYVEEKEVDTAAPSSVPVTSETDCGTAPATPTPRKIKRQAPPVPAPRPSLAKNQSNSITSSSSSSCRQSGAEESESGLSTLPKITSDESHSETPPTAAATAQEFDFIKPVRPPRKKKMRRTLTWKKENSIVEATANTVISTDSDSDYRKPQQAQQGKKKVTVSVPQPQPQAQPEQSYIELDKSLMRQVNSPRKIKSAYTLTVMSSPSPNGDSDQSLSQTPRQSLEQEEQEKGQQEQEKEQQQQLRESFIDQGFETGSNDASPMRRTSLDGGKPSNFSTPIKAATASAKQQLFSPIGPVDKSRRSSIAMQVIREDHPLDLDLVSPTATTPTCSEREFFANAPTVEMSSSQLSDESPKSSKFWIGAGEFTVSLDIQHNSSDRLRLLYEIFTQKSWETKEFTFGIDGHKFIRDTTAGARAASPKDFPEHSSSVKSFSHYWFASGDLAVPFSGKHMSGEKVERLFRFIEAELEQEPERELRFGVDHFEFSSVPEFWLNTPKFSMESSYSMLVGLQTGSSNGLEGRSKYAWPNHPTQTLRQDNSNQAIKTSDLDQTEFESDCFSSNSGSLSFSPDLFSQDYEAVPLDELFNKTLPKERCSTSHAKTYMTVPQMVHTLQQQQTRLKNVEQRMRTYEMPLRLNESTLKKCRSKPEYTQRLKAIDNIARSNGFSACSMAELEDFMQFLIEYADVCLGSCSEHIDKIIDNLMNRRAVAV